MDQFDPFIHEPYADDILSAATFMRLITVNMQS